MREWQLPIDKGRKGGKTGRANSKADPTIGAIAIEHDLAIVGGVTGDEGAGTPVVNPRRAAAWP